MCQSSKLLEVETLEFITAMIKSTDTFNSILISQLNI